MEDDLIPRLLVCWFCCLLGAPIALPICSIIIAKHNEVQGWARGKANVVDPDATTTNFESRSRATVKANVIIPELGANRTFAVVLTYPGPPAALNWKSKEEVKTWVTFVHTTPDVQVFVDTSSNSEPYIAVTENVSVDIPILFLVLSIAYYVFCMPIGIWWLIKECRSGEEDDAPESWKEVRIDVDNDESTTSSSDEACGGSQEKSANKGVTTCILCTNMPTAIVFIPCGHVCCCETCRSKLEKCPICRTTITRCQKLYIV